MGEHIDYIGGTVLPFACDLQLTVTAEPFPDAVVLRSHGEEITVALDADRAPDGWGRHVWGVVRALRDAGAQVSGCRGEVRSTIPTGAGLSSSTALEVAVALAVGRGARPEPEVLRRAEQIATGVPCGVMDQTAILEGRAGHALMLDCATGAFEHVPIPDDIGFAVIDTGTRRELSDGRYALRRSEVEGGDAKRLRHAQTEQRRVWDAAEALRAGDIDALGACISASHASLRDDYEVSSDELDLAAAAAESHAGCTGARLLGGGFAGCVLAVCEGGARGAAELAGAVAGALRTRLRDAAGYAVRAVDGAGEVP